MRKSAIHHDQAILVSDVRFIQSSEDQRAEGLLGWVGLRLNRCMQMNSIALRRTRDGRLTLSFPARRDGAGLIHHYYKPLDRETQVEIERQVFLALGMEGAA
jgi:hypothetical protein